MTGVRAATWRVARHHRRRERGVKRINGCNNYRRACGARISSLTTSGASADDVVCAFYGDIMAACARENRWHARTLCLHARTHARARIALSACLCCLCLPLSSSLRVHLPAALPACTTTYTTARASSLLHTCLYSHCTLHTHTTVFTPRIPFSTHTTSLLLPAIFLPSHCCTAPFHCTAFPAHCAFLHTTTPVLPPSLPLHTFYLPSHLHTFYLCTAHITATLVLTSPLFLPHCIHTHLHTHLCLLVGGQVGFPSPEERFLLQA